jgi:hypothetical protein
MLTSAQVFLWLAALQIDRVLIGYGANRTDHARLFARRWYAVCLLGEQAGEVVLYRSCTP